MSSFESTGFPTPEQHPPLGQEAHQPEPFVPLAPMQPFDEIQPLQAEPAQEPFQPLQPLVAAPIETFPVQQPERVQLQSVELLQPLAPPPVLEPLQPTMPPPLPPLSARAPETASESAAPPPPVAPAPSPEEVANLGVPLGTLIFRAGLLTEEQLEDALQEGVRTGKRLGEVLLESGLLDERDLGRLLADQKGLRFVELSHVTPDPATAALLSAEKAHMFAALPVGFEHGVPLVAVADPSNELVTENLRRALGSEPRLVVASRSDLHATIDRMHGAVAEEPVAQVEEPVAQIEPVVAEPEPAPVQAERVEPPTFAPPAVEPEPAVEAMPVASPPVFAPVAVQPAPVPTLVPQPDPAPVPAPVLQSVEVEHVARAPEPQVTDQATVAPLVSPVEPAPTPYLAEPAVAEPVVEALAQTYSSIEEEQAHEDLGAEQELPLAMSYDVSLRLTDGERVPVGSFGDPQKAREYAREVVSHLSDETDGWPFFSGRFMRPETIVSVDIVPVGEPDRWLGSSMRANWASRLNR